MCSYCGGTSVLGAVLWLIRIAITSYPGIEARVSIKGSDT